MTFPGSHGRACVSWWGASAPTSGPVGTTATYVGVKVWFRVPGRVFGFRAYRDTAQTDAGFGIFWKVSGPELQSAYAFKDVPHGTGWQNTWIRPTIRIEVDTDYMLAVMFPQGRLYRTSSALTVEVEHDHIDFLKSFQTTGLVPELATITLNTNANGVDFLFMPD